jgi:HD-like signal output (HDOD) protein
MDPAIAQAFAQVPMLPDHIQHLFTIINDPEGELRDVADLVCRDPSLTAQSLRVCNSALFSLPVEITSIHQAVVLLGLEMVQGIALASYFQSSVLQRRGLPGGWMDGAADHAMTTAYLCRWFLQAMGDHLLAATAFTAGLIHDIGKLAFCHLGRAVETKVLARVADGHDWCVAEYEILGMTHAEAGGHVCERWDIPDTLTQAVRHHHSPLESIDEPMACVVHIADRLAHAAHTDGDAAGPLVGIEPAAWQSLGLDDAEMAHLAADLLKTLETTPMTAV